MQSRRFPGPHDQIKDSLRLPAETESVVNRSS